MMELFKVVRLYLACFALGVLVGGFLLKGSTHIVKEDTSIHATAEKAIIKKNGDVEVYHPVFNFKKDTLDKTTHSVGGLYVGGGYDVLTQTKNAALGYDLGGVFVVSTVTLDLKSVGLNLLFNL